MKSIDDFRHETMLISSSRSTQPELSNDMSHDMCLILTFDPDS